MDDAKLQGAADAADEWLAGVPEELRSVAKEHGREAFQMAIWAGTAQHALGILGRQTRGNRRAQQALVIVGSLFNTVIKELAGGEAIAAANRCKADVELIAALAHGGKPAGEEIRNGCALCPGRIILNS